uniref:Translocase of outer mitochondrial membrane 20 like n=1 Tax=Pelusios castaneus TaxID=367368 RepID=A0A8C8RAF0_9SAUR
SVGRAGAAMGGWARPLLVLLAGAFGLALFGYCVYFDRQRRTAPDFRQRLRQSEWPQLTGLLLGLPRIMKTIGRIQEFFLQEIELGEHWLSRGDHKKSLEHLTNAMSVCAQPHQLLQLLHQSLPPQVFEMLLQRIPYTTQISAQFHQSEFSSPIT